MFVANNFFYSGKIEETNVDVLILLLAASDRYDVLKLKALCVKLLLRGLNPENALEMCSAGEIGNVQSYKYEWNVIIPPYSKMLKNYESTGNKIEIKNIQFNEGDLASHNHSIDLILDVDVDRGCHARLTFLLDTNITFKQCEVLTLKENEVKKMVLFNFHQDFEKYDAIPHYKRKGQYIWWTSVPVGLLADYIDTLRFVFNMEYHYRNIVANMKDFPNTKGIELEADRFFLSKDLSDVTFICENEEFCAHRFALASKSSVFEKMFLTNMKEKIDNHVNIEGINKEVFKTFLHFFYSGKIREHNVDFLIPLLAAADRYDVPQLKGLCVKFLLRGLSPENALEIYSAGEAHNASALTLEATDVIKKNKHASIPDETALQYYINKHPSLMFELFKM